MLQKRGAGIMNSVKKAFLAEVNSIRALYKSCKLTSLRLFGFQLCDDHMPSKRDDFGMIVTFKRNESMDVVQKYQQLEQIRERMGDLFKKHDLTVLINTPTSLQYITTGTGCWSRNLDQSEVKGIIETSVPFEELVKRLQKEKENEQLVDNESSLKR